MFGGKRIISSQGRIGLCLQQTGVSFARVQWRKSGGPVLLDCQKIEGVDEARRSALEQLVRQRKLQGARTVLVLPVDDYQLMQVEMAELPADERRDAARWQIREMIDYPAAEAVVDLIDVVSYGSDRKPLTYVVSSRQTLLRSRLEMLAAVALKPEIIDISEFSLRNIADLYDAENRGVAILYLQADSGLLTIAREGTFYLTRSFPLGMNDLLPLVEGDLEALTEKVDLIVLEIQRSFDYCESTFHLPTVSRLLVAQTEKEIPAVTKYLADFVPTRVEPLSFDGVLELPEGIEQLELNRHLLAIGGALRRELD